MAGPSDYERLHELERHGLGANTRRYAEQDHDWLFVAYHRDRLVATRRTSRVMRDNVVSRVVKLGPGQYWGADLFCLPEYRNRGIGRHLKIFGDRHMASLGYKEFYSTVSPSNTASLRASRAAGREAVYYVSYVKVLFWERLRVSRDVPQHFWDG